MLGIQLRLRGHVVEVAANSHHPQVFGRELNLGVHRVEFPSGHFFHYLREHKPVGASTYFYTNRVCRSRRRLPP